MLNLKNLSPKAFIDYIQNKDLYIFGSGELAKASIDIYCKNKMAVALIDNNSKLWGTYKSVGEYNVPIVSVNDFVSRVKDNTEKSVLLVTPTFYAEEIICQLDNISEIDGMDCFIHLLIRNTKDEDIKFDFTKGVSKIPKKIHYFWIGGNPLPEQYQIYIDTWKKYNNDYEIIRWDESNYDFTKNKYMKEAYENKAWAFATDYARLDIIYQYGGIYFDTDVEAIKNLDCLLNDECFWGMWCADRIGVGVGFGATPQNTFVKRLMDFYDDKSFIDKFGKINKLTGNVTQKPIFMDYGFKLNNCYEKIDDVVIYPAEVMSPKGMMGLGNFYSENTLTIHHGGSAGGTEKERKLLEKFKVFISKRLG